MSIVTLGGRSTGFNQIGLETAEINQTVDNLIYFGGSENLTNAFNRISLGFGRVRSKALPVNVLVTASHEPVTFQLAQVFEILRKAKCRLLVVAVNLKEKNKFASFLSQLQVSIVNVRHWDSLLRHSYQVIDYLNSIS